METIEERAEEWVSSIINRLDTTDLEMGYIRGAYEQRQIDLEEQTREMDGLNRDWEESLAIQRKMLINKACEWLLNSLPTPDWYGSTEAFVDEFRKAMEE